MIKSNVLITVICDHLRWLFQKREHRNLIIFFNIGDTMIIQQSPCTMLYVIISRFQTRIQTPTHTHALAKLLLHGPPLIPRPTATVKARLGSER